MKDVLNIAGRALLFAVFGILLLIAFLGCIMAPAAGAIWVASLFSGEFSTQFFAGLAGAGFGLMFAIGLATQVQD